jgi:hypothetical protein
MKVLSGHLTTLDKQNITYLINRGMFYGKSKLKQYEITKPTPAPGEYGITVYDKYTATIGDTPKWHKSHAVIQL